MDSEHNNNDSVIHVGQSELFGSSASHYTGSKHFHVTMRHDRRATQESSDGKSMDEISNISETHLILKSVKIELQKLIEYNLSGYTHHLSYEIISATDRNKTVKPVQHETQEWNKCMVHTEPRKTKKAANVESLETRSDGIPSDILQRSYSNPNFFSSVHSETHTSQNLTGKQS